MQSFQEIKKRHKNQQEIHGKSYRIGQYFCNKFIKQEWPELFHANEKDAEAMIIKWLVNHNYEDVLPPFVLSVGK